MPTAVTGRTAKRTHDQKLSDTLSVLDFKPDGDKVTDAALVVMTDGASHVIGTYFSSFALASAQYPFLDSTRWAAQDAVWAMWQAALNWGGQIYMPIGNYYIGGIDRLSMTKPGCKIFGSGSASRFIWNPSAGNYSTTTSGSITASPSSAITITVGSTTNFRVGAALLDVGGVQDTVNIIAVLSSTTLRVFGVLNSHSSGVALTQDMVLLTLTSLAGGINGTANNMQLMDFRIMNYNRNGPAVVSDGGNNAAKTGIDLIDVSGLVIERIGIELSDTTGATISLRSHGRQTVSTYKLELWYGRPYVMSQNPNTTGSEASDHFHHRSWYCVAAAGQIHLEFQNVAISNTSWDGLEMALGRWGVTWTATYAAVSNNITFRNCRLEQASPPSGQSAGYAFFLAPFYGIQGLEISNCYSVCAGDPTTAPNKLNGIILRNISGGVIENYTHVGPTGYTTVADVDNTCSLRMKTFSSAAGGFIPDALGATPYFLDSSLISVQTGIEHRGDRSRVQRSDVSSETPSSVITNSPLPSGSTSMTVLSTAGFKTTNANILNDDGTTSETVLVAVVNSTTMSCTATSVAHPYGTRIIQGTVYAKPSWILEVCNRYGFKPQVYNAYGRGAGMFFSDGIMVMGGITGVREHTTLYQGHLDFYVNSGLPLTGQGDPNISSTFAARISKDGFLGLSTRRPITMLSNTPVTVGDGNTYHPLLTVNAAPGATSLTVASGLGLAAGLASFATGNPEQVTITTIVGTTVNLSGPLQYAHASGDTLSQNLGVGVLSTGLSWLYTSGIGYAAAFENWSSTAGSDGMLVKVNSTDSGSWIFNGQVTGNTKFGGRSDGYVVLSGARMLWPAEATMIAGYQLQVTGSTLAGYQLGWAPTGILSGTGSPNGVKTAGVGVMYEQQDAASGDTAWWIKGSGAGNTGWVARNTFNNVLTGTLNIGLSSAGYGLITNVASGGISDSGSVGGLSTTSIQWRQSTIGYCVAFENTDSTAGARNNLLVKIAASDAASYALWIDTGGQAGALKVSGDGFATFTKGLKWGTSGTALITAGVYAAPGPIQTGYLGTVADQPFHLFQNNTALLRLTSIPDLAGGSGVHRVEIDLLYLPIAATTNPGVLKLAATTGAVGAGSLPITNAHYIDSGATSDGDFLQSMTGAIRGRDAAGLSADIQAALLADSDFQAGLITFIDAEIVAQTGVTIAAHPHSHGATVGGHAHNTNVPTGAGGSYTSSTSSDSVSIGNDI